MVGCVCAIPAEAGMGGRQTPGGTVEPRGWARENQVGMESEATIDRCKGQSPPMAILTVAMADKTKLPAGVPIRIVAALSKTDKYRKPNSGMFDLVRDLYRTKGLEVDMDKSVYVGDAAGRMALGSRKKDHGDTDFKLALNVGLKFVTPEVGLRETFKLYWVACG